MIHVAVLMRPYVELILSGEKTVECRLTKHARPPFNGVEPGDRIYFKESAGPWRLTAIVEQALFEQDLTPKRIREIRRDYNDVIHGDPQYWSWKKDARFLTLIWLRDVEPIETGPGVRPLQGAAWLTLPKTQGGMPTARGGHEGKPMLAPSSKHATRQRTVEQGRLDRSAPEASPPLSFSIPITEGNLRNASLYVTTVLDRFPSWCLGGPNRSEQARPVTLVLRDGPVVETDIVLKRKLFRARPWGKWYEAVGARPGDLVVFTPLDEATWFVGHSRRG
jgi:ASC-1-like (ASCH) protein